MDPSKGDDALVILLLALAASEFDDPEWLDHLLHRLRRSNRWSRVLAEDPELFDLLVHTRPGRRRRVEKQARETAISVVEGFRLGQDKKLSELEASIDQLRREQVETGARLGRTEEHAASAAIDLHSFMFLAAAGADLGRAKFRRYVPARIYLAEARPHESALAELRREVDALADALGFETADDLPERNGSWFKEWILRTKDKVWTPAVEETAIILKDGQVAKHGWMPQAQVDLTHAETLKAKAEADRACGEADLAHAQAAKIRAEIEDRAQDRILAVAAALERTSGNACFLVGRVLGLKMVDGRSTRTLVVHLDDRAFARLAEDPSVVERPQDVLGWLRENAGLDQSPITGSTPAPPILPKRLSDDQGKDEDKDAAR